MESMTHAAQMQGFDLHEDGPSIPGLGGEGFPGMLRNLRLCDARHQLEADLTVHALAVQQQLRILRLI